MDAPCETRTPTRSASLMSPTHERPYLLGPYVSIWTGIPISVVIGVEGNSDFGFEG